jgi:hypothetical protein
MSSPAARTPRRLGSGPPPPAPTRPPPRRPAPPPATPAPAGGGAGAAGQVVGITTANASVGGQSSGSIGVGFASPSKRVEQVVSRLSGRP